MSSCHRDYAPTVNSHPANGAWLALAIVVLLTILPTSAVSAEEVVEPRIEEFTADANPPMEDFSMLAGLWDVESRSVRDRLANDKVWVLNRMQTRYRILLDGLVAINDTFGTFNGRPMHGIMIRTYDPVKNEWYFQWMSQGYPHLTPQVRGRFEDGVGMFHGTEEHGGKTFQMRFRWKMISENHAFWEQSYLNPKTGAWEPNWTLDLTRLDASEARSGLHE